MHGGVGIDGDFFGECAGEIDADIGAEDEAHITDRDAGDTGADGEDASDAVAAEDVGEGGFGGILADGKVGVGGIEGGELEVEEELAAAGDGIGNVREGHGGDACVGGKEPGFHGDLQVRERAGLLARGIFNFGWRRVKVAIARPHRTMGRILWLDVPHPADGIYFSED